MNDRDSDSLATQAQKFPDTLRVITGRFERNPPLFYQMRIRRSLAQLKKNPREFGLYDDIAVAYDRLHRDDEALQIMAKKRALLPPFDAKNAKMKEAWYRYFANAGTFRAHRYLGAKSQNIKEMQTARDFIKRAIEIKPNAHFGREKYQLLAMDWILAPKGGQNTRTLADWMYDRTQENPSQATQGLSGLIVLGAAWQSVDVFQALASSLNTENGLTLSYLASLRTQELLKEGSNSLASKAMISTMIDHDLTTPLSRDGMRINKENQKTLRELFPKLRAEADSWAAARNAYMLSRLEKGDHPDTNPKFWADWKPAAPPSLEVAWFNQKQDKEDQRQKAFLVAKMVKVALILLACVVALNWGLRLRAQQRQYRSNFLE